MDIFIRGSRLFPFWTIFLIIYIFVKERNIVKLMINLFKGVVNIVNRSVFKPQANVTIKCLHQFELSFKKYFKL